MTDARPLPKGQYQLNEFPRFGLAQFANKQPSSIAEIALQLVGQVDNEVRITGELKELTRVEQVSDFHCVTTWSRLSISWSGYRFKEFYEKLVVPLAKPAAGADILVFKGQDGARSSLMLEDALADDVLLVDGLNGAPLPIEHGGPLRLIAPQHYGYKSVKYLSSIRILSEYADYRPSAFRFMDHPRARVQQEERGRWLPGWVYRYLYRPLVQPTIKRYKRAQQRRQP